VVSGEDRRGPVLFREEELLCNSIVLEPFNLYRGKSWGEKVGEDMPLNHL
jgi:hypothetical protein